uniref:Uncharacterized protein n=1 Tax=Rhizophora mucronata TaxID=61149 RepID=A0A2P2QUB2_RHIMU
MKYHSINLGKEIILGKRKLIRVSSSLLIRMFLFSTVPADDFSIKEFTD